MLNQPSNLPFARITIEAIQSKRAPSGQAKATQIHKDPNAFSAQRRNRSIPTHVRRANKPSCRHQSQWAQSERKRLPVGSLTSLKICATLTEFSMKTLKKLPFQKEAGRLLKIALPYLRKARLLQAILPKRLRNPDRWIYTGRQTKQCSRLIIGGPIPIIS